MDALIAFFISILSEYVSFFSVFVVYYVEFYLIW